MCESGISVFLFFRRLEVSTLARLLMPGEAKALYRLKVLEGNFGKKRRSWPGQQERATSKSCNLKF